MSTNRIQTLSIRIGIPAGLALGVLLLVTACSNGKDISSSFAPDSPEDCDQLGDEDGNGAADCADPACTGLTGPNGETCEQPEETCDDDFDNDGDGATDCADPDCEGDDACQEDCDNGVDDDDPDGLADCADPDCVGETGPNGETCEMPEETCDDGEDNDGDGSTDCGDPDCDADPACDFTENCSNGVDDNDPDDLADCADPECEGQTGPNGETCEMPEESCDDGEDNDGDGATDCADPDCDGVAPCGNCSADFIGPGEASCYKENVNTHSYNVPDPCPDSSGPLTVRILFMDIEGGEAIVSIDLCDNPSCNQTSVLVADAPCSDLCLDDSDSFECEIDDPTTDSGSRTFSITLVEPGVITGTIDDDCGFPVPLTGGQGTLTAGSASQCD